MALRRFCYLDNADAAVSLEGTRMNVQRFAGESPIFQKFAEQMAQNDALMRQRQSETMQNAYQQRARDVAATGVSNAGSSCSHP